MPRVLQLSLHVHTVDPEIYVAFAREVALLSLCQFVLPALFQPAQRGRGQPRSIGAQEGL
jgi:hypothetical protein